jgi:hypothetical protein
MESEVKIMKRVIKFPLIMSDGKEVRTIDELRENFSLEKIIEYYLDGKLKTWLQQRNCIEELSQLEKLQCCEDRNQIPVMLCKIFDVEQPVDLNVSEIERRKSRLSILKSFSDDEKWEEKLEFIAFNQEELEKKLFIGSLCNVLCNKTQVQRREIYLCGEMFNISDKVKNITYVGVNTSLVNIITKNVFDAKTNNIKFENVKITSEAMVEAVITDSDKCTIDDRMVTIRKMWDKTPTIIDGLNFDKILIYKNKLIGAYIGMHDGDVFRIVDINTGSVLKKLSDLKAAFSGNTSSGFYSSIFMNTMKIGVYAMTIFEDTLVCFCGEWPGKNGRIIYINLETLEISKSYKVPEGHDGNSYIYHPDEIGVANGKISLCQRGSIRIKCQYHDYNTGECLGTKSIEALDNSIYRDGKDYCQFYKGNIYLFSPKKKKMVTDNKEYNFKGFKREPSRHNNEGIADFSAVGKSIASLFGTMSSSNSESSLTGKIGTFDIFEDKVVAAGCYVRESSGTRIAYESTVQDGYIAVYNITGGDVIKSLKISNSAIKIIKYYDGVLIAVCEDGQVKILDAKTLDTVNSFALFENAKIDANDPLQNVLKVMSNMYEKECSIYIDDNTDKMAVLYDRKIYLYE